MSDSHKVYLKVPGQINIISKPELRTKPPFGGIPSAGWSLYFAQKYILQKPARWAPTSYKML